MSPTRLSTFRPRTIPPEYAESFLPRHWYEQGFITGRVGVKPSPVIVRALLATYTMTTAQAYEAGAYAGLEALRSETKVEESR